uniref:Ovule protein n=1 Tax=Caenorhabditis tropicalis TaxID=1561998 RepID=A0A1I7UNJ1_9PELO
MEPIPASFFIKCPTVDPKQVNQKIHSFFICPILSSSLGARRDAVLFEVSFYIGTSGRLLKTKEEEKKGRPGNWRSFDDTFKCKKEMTQAEIQIRRRCKKRKRKDSLDPVKGNGPTI